MPSGRSGERVLSVSRPPARSISIQLKPGGSASGPLRALNILGTTSTSRSPRKMAVPAAKRPVSDPPMTSERRFTLDDYHESLKLPVRRL